MSSPTVSASTRRPRRTRGAGTGFGDVISLDDPLVRDAMDRFGLTTDQVKDLLGVVTSVHIFALK